MINKYLIPAICIGVLTACAQEPVTRDATSPGDSFADAYAAAEVALAAAEASRNVWSNTDSLLQRSKVAYDAGRVADAVALANEARLQAELALEQAISQKEDWKQNVLFE